MNKPHSSRSSSEASEFPTLSDPFKDRSATAVVFAPPHFAFPAQIRGKRAYIRAIDEMPHS
jgi:hypothetical protein